MLTEFIQDYLWIGFHVLETKFSKFIKFIGSYLFCSCECNDGEHSVNNFSYCSLEFFYFNYFYSINIFTVSNVFFGDCFGVYSIQF